MKYFIKLSALLLFSVIAVVFLWVLMTKSPSYASSPDTSVQMISSAKNAPNVSSRYVATIWKDSMAIFETDNMSSPKYISDVVLTTLTKEDINKLKDGIYLDTKEDISRLLEDFES